MTSVDGLDIMTGKRARPDSSGYVITPASHATANDIPGFRLNQDEVAAFRFGDRRDSYAARLDRPENVGVIGVIFFSEFDPEPYRGGCFPLSKGGLEGTRGGGRMRGGHDMGTEFGDRQEHRVSSTYFDKDREVARFVIEYASRESLIASGIITESPLGHVDPFCDGGGCTPPPGWRG